MEKTIIALPNGEWWDSLEEAFRMSDVLLVRTSKRNYRIELPTADITGVMTRTKDVPEIVDDPTSTAVAGMTGSDILANAGKRTIASPSMNEQVIPIRKLVSTAPKPTIYLATTPNCPTESDGSMNINAILEGVHRDGIHRSASAVVPGKRLSPSPKQAISRKN